MLHAFSGLKAYGLDGFESRHKLITRALLALPGNLVFKCRDVLGHSGSHEVRERELCVGGDVLKPRQE